MRCISCLLVLSLTLCCASCGGEGLYPVSGKVLCQGTPATGAAVFFRRRGADTVNEHVIMAIVQKDGSFELVCGPRGKGAPPGEYDVLIEWKETTQEKGKGRLQQRPDKLQGRYGDPHRPLLHARVEPKANQLPAFNITN